MDDNDKIRRNLVVFSSATIYASWVGITIEKPTIEFFTSSIKINLPSPNTLWIGTLVLLLYFLFRFIRSKENILEKPKRETAHLQNFLKQMCQLLEKELKAGRVDSFVDTDDKVLVQNPVVISEIAKNINNNITKNTKVVVASEELNEWREAPLHYSITISITDSAISDPIRLGREWSMCFPGSVPVEEGALRNSIAGSSYNETTCVYNRILSFQPTAPKLFLCLLKTKINWLTQTEYGILYTFPITLGLIAAISSTVKWIIS